MFAKLKDISEYEKKHQKFDDFSVTFSPYPNTEYSEIPANMKIFK